MYATDTETIIPKYALAANEATGNTMLSVNTANCSVNYNRADFLVPHRKDYYFLVFVKQGSSRHWIDMKPYTIKPDTLYFSTPHQVNLKEEPKPFTGLSIAFTEEFLTMLENDMVRNLPIILNPHNGHQLDLNAADVIFVEDILDKIYNEYHTEDNWQHSMLKGYMQILLIYLSRLYTAHYNNTAEANERILLQKYLQKIESNFTQFHDVVSYASMLNISAGHLSEVVKQQSGEPAISHIHKRLVLEAKRLLFHSDKSIKEIAFNLGFEDASYFNRFFKRLVNDTPAAYRIRIREMYH